MNILTIEHNSGRSVPEWIGKTPDTKVPPRVRLRVFNAHDGICHISDRKIRPGDKWELEHIKRLKDGGENRESNLAPALIDFHQEKTNAENTLQAKEDRIRKKHLGIKSGRSQWPCGKNKPFKKLMSGKVVRR